MTDFKLTTHQTPKKPGIIISFLGSMNLAVTLLVMLAIASVIGTILKQDESLQAYIIKFGPFWADVFHTLGLYHVYGAAWFILVLLFLLISTGTCLSRNTFPFLKEIKQFSEKMSITAYQHQPYHVELDGERFDKAKAQAFLEEEGYKTKIHENNEQITVAAIKGRWNRLGYIFTHSAIIVICIGALLDSNLLLKYRELSGHLKPETRSVPLSQIPEISQLSPSNFSFRGTVNVPEGQHTNVLFLPYKEGFLVQKLPFTLKVKHFRVKFYDTGMPKSFESDVVLSAPDLKKPIEKTISVNHPLLYKNYAIYQSSFGDGGSKLDLKIYPLLSPVVNPLVMHSAIKSSESLETPVGKFKIEFGDFKLFNIVPATKAQKAKNGHKMHNNGPSIIFKVRNNQGIAWEYENFMQPSLQQGRLFFMTGVRSNPSSPYRYLFIPADKQKSKARFFQFLALINNPIKSASILKKAFPKPANMTLKTYQLQLKLMSQMLTLFKVKGFNGITEFVQKTIPKKDQKKVSDFYFAQTSNVLQTLYLSVLKSEKENLTQGIDKFDQKWFEDALTAMTGIPKYGPPMYVELTGFKHIQSTGMQITKSPGKDVVFGGSALLVLGIIFLFYVRQKHIWISFSKVTKQLTIAGKDRKDLPETQTEFNEIVDDYKEELL